jgi:hypothetical protein
MRNVNFKFILNSLALIALFMFFGAGVTIAQTGKLAGSTSPTTTKQPVYIGTQQAKTKLQAKLPALYTELNNLLPESPAYKKKYHEVLAYKEMISGLNQGKPVSQVYADAIETLKQGFNLNNAVDVQEMRSITIILKSLLTTP